MVSCGRFTEALLEMQITQLADREEGAEMGAGGRQMRKAIDTLKATITIAILLGMGIAFIMAVPI